MGAMSESDQDMAAGQIPESWIGQEVKVRYWYGDGRGSMDCTLQAIADKGIVLDAGDNIRFLPWSAVLHIQQGKPGVEQESGGSSSRRARATMVGRR